jgi:DNA (cytosine-5)-methyltransferase 1
MTPSLEELSETSDKQGMKQFGLLFRLAPSTPRTEGIESGLLPSPKSIEVDASKTSKGTHGFNRIASDGREWGNNLGTLIPMLPSPRAGNPGSRPNKKGGKILAEEIAKAGMLPTPKAIDGIVRHSEKMARKKTENNGDVDLSIAIMMSQDGKRTGMKLQPAFVEWMMGFPIGWTEIDRVS